MSNPNPTQENQRLPSLDIIRGIAVLGILLMNIQSFSMPESAYSNPTAYGDLTGLNYTFWLFDYLFVSGKFIGLFSLLFGAGVILFLERIERNNLSPSVHFLRMFWLMIFGLLHAYLFWEGDILFSYAICGFILYFCRNLTSKSLWLTGSILLTIWFSIFMLGQLGVEYFTESDGAEILEDWAPNQTLINEEIRIRTGSWMQNFNFRLSKSIEMQTEGLLFLVLWISGSQMLFGMALYKQGLFTVQSKLNTTFLAVAFTSVGLLIGLFAVYFNEANSWRWQQSLFFGTVLSFLSSTIMSLGFLFALISISNNFSGSALFNRLAAVGRMAFTNYIIQTVICSLLFYGFGLGLFGGVDRTGQHLIVVAIWALILFYSPVWLNNYRYGPLEWLWRCLTYMQWVPNKIKK